MRKLFIGILVVGVVFGMSLGVMAETEGNIADVNQSNGAEAVVEQLGSNEAYLTQKTGGGTYNAIADFYQEGDGNYIDLFQNVWSAHNTSRADIEQLGDDNTVAGGMNLEDAAEQDNSAVLDVFQEGNLNEVFVSQTTNYSTDKAYIEQTGDENLIELEQENGQAWLEQLGDENVFRLDQKNSEFPEQNEEDLFFTQDGDKNKFVGVDEDGNQTDWAVQVDSTFNGFQEGDKNVIGLYQGGDDDASTTQDGDRNEALLFQGDENGHIADIVQTGNNNEAEVIQTSN